MVDPCSTWLWFHPMWCFPYAFHSAPSHLSPALLGIALSAFYFQIIAEKYLLLKEILSFLQPLTLTQTAHLSMRICIQDKVGWWGASKRLWKEPDMSPCHGVAGVWHALELDLISCFVHRVKEKVAGCCVWLTRPEQSLPEQELLECFLGTRCCERQPVWGCLMSCPRRPSGGAVGTQGWGRGLIPPSQAYPGHHLKGAEVSIVVSVVHSLGKLQNCSMPPKKFKALLSHGLSGGKRQAWA